MKKPLLIDTNFILAFADTNDSCHKLAKDILSKFDKTQQFLVPQIVVAELLIHKAPTDFILLAHEFAPKLTTISDSDLDFIKEMDISIKSKLKAIDCLLLSMCKRLNAELLTFDESLMKTYHNFCR